MLYPVIARNDQVFLIQGTKLNCIYHLRKLNKNEAFSASEAQKAPVVKHCKVSDSRNELPQQSLKVMHYRVHPTSCESAWFWLAKHHRKTWKQNVINFRFQSLSLYDIYASIYLDCVSVRLFSKATTCSLVSDGLVSSKSFSLFSRASFSLMMGPFSASIFAVSSLLRFSFSICHRSLSSLRTAAVSPFCEVAVVVSSTAGWIALSCFSSSSNLAKSVSLCFNWFCNFSYTKVTTDWVLITLQSRPCVWFEVGISPFCFQSLNSLDQPIKRTPTWPDGLSQGPWLNLQLEFVVHSHSFSSEPPPDF